MNSNTPHWRLDFVHETDSYTNLREAVNCGWLSPCIQYGIWKTCCTRVCSTWSRIFLSVPQFTQPSLFCPTSMDARSFPESALMFVAIFSVQPSTTTSRGELTIQLEIHKGVDKTIHCNIVKAVNMPRAATGDSYCKWPPPCHVAEGFPSVQGSRCVEYLEYVQSNIWAQTMKTTQSAGVSLLLQCVWFQPGFPFPTVFARARHANFSNKPGVSFSLGAVRHYLDFQWNETFLFVGGWVKQCFVPIDISMHVMSMCRS